jgi:hypothetical protein
LNKAVSGLIASAFFIGCFAWEVTSKFPAAAALDKIMVPRPWTSD